MQQGLERGSWNRSHEMHQYSRKESAHDAEHTLVGGTALRGKLEEAIHHTKLLFQRVRYLRERLRNKVGCAQRHSNVGPIRHKLAGNAQAIMTSRVAIDGTQLAEFGRRGLANK
eukprot:6472111-Amphidinium_carterae.1